MMIDERIWVWLRRPGAITRVCVVLSAVVLSVALVLAAGDPPASGMPDAKEKASHAYTMSDALRELGTAGVRLPLATALGTLLALRPRRRGTPMRQPAVVQTQIVLAIVGAVIMLVVQDSIARAFGIVGVASLIRYRSKIDDPKDAVVMLSALAVGLASGTGVYALATFGTLFLTATLWVIEGFEPQKRSFDLTVKLGDQTAVLQPRIEGVLRRFKTDFELRGSSESEVTYFVNAPIDLQTDRISRALMALEPGGKGAVEWNENAKAKSKAKAQ
jgi:uncharacterized membrane protein YhiD involved in acid resistance